MKGRGEDRKEESDWSREKSDRSGKFLKQSWQVAGANRRDTRGSPSPKVKYYPMRRILDTKATNRMRRRGREPNSNKMRGTK